MNRKIQILGAILFLLFVAVMCIIIMLLPKETDDNFVELDTVSVNGVVFRDPNYYITINVKDDKVFVIDALDNRTFTFSGISALNPESVANREDDKFAQDLKNKGINIEKSSFHYLINNMAVAVSENGKAELYIRVDGKIRTFDLYLQKTSYITDIAKKLATYNETIFDESSGNLYFTTTYELAKYDETLNAITINNEQFILPEEIKPYMGSMDGVESLIAASNYSEVAFTQKNSKYVIPLPLNVTLSINNQNEISLYDEASHSYNYISDSMTQDHDGKVVLK